MLATKWLVYEIGRDRSMKLGPRECFRDELGPHSAEVGTTWAPALQAGLPCTWSLCHCSDSQPTSFGMFANSLVPTANSNIILLDVCCILSTKSSTMYYNMYICKCQYRIPVGLALEDLLSDLPRCHCSQLHRPRGPGVGNQAQGGLAPPSFSRRGCGISFWAVLKIWSSHFVGLPSHGMAQL